MISITHRFHGHGSLQFLYKNGKVVRGAAASLRYSPNPKRKDYRAAVVVSKKVSKSAVVRNRVRRRIYERVRILSSDFTGVYDIAFLVYDEKMATISPDQLQKDITTLLKKAAIIGATRPSHDIVDAKE